MIHSIQIFLSLFLESFPISSSGHLELFNRMATMYNGSDLLITIPSWMEYFVHIPIVLSVAIYFAPRWLPIMLHPLRYRSYLFTLISRGFMVELVTVGWFVLFEIIGKQWFPLCAGFMITAIILMMSRYFVSQPTNNNRLTYRNAVIFGMVQGCALLPGISRFGSTFVVALIMGFAPRRAFEYSFLIEVPLSVAGGLLGLYEMHKFSIILSFADICAIVVGMLGMIGGLWIMQRIIDKKGLWLFSWYMVVVAFVCMIL